MSIIDFREIPKAHISTGDQDLFELFARDFLEALGFRIIEGPGRGVDRGRDLLVAEKIDGFISTQEKVWVVSVKHKAHSGKSITDADEPDPIGRVRKFKADGFMGFYSTLPSSGLEDTLTRIRPDVDTYIFDRGRIEGKILSRLELQTVFQRYFSKSYKNWIRQEDQGQRVVEIWGEVEPLNCCYCGKDILLEDNAVVVIVYELIEYPKRKIVDVYWACKGRCDDKLNVFTPKDTLTGWEDIADLRIPLVFIKWVFMVINRIRNNVDTYEDEAYEKHLRFILAMFQTVMKNTSEEQKERIEMLRDIPAFLGGLSNW